MSSQATTGICPICGGTGMKPAADNRYTRCECVLVGRSERLLQAARIPPRFEHCELAEFSTLNESLTMAKLAAEAFVDRYPVERTGLLFTGDKGLGKTHLSVGIIRELTLKKGIRCLFYDYHELLKNMQTSWNTSVDFSEYEVLEPVFEAEVLVLDDLGVVRASEWKWDALDQILNTRYNSNRTTIVTTNFSDAPDAKTRDRLGQRDSFSQSAKAKRAAAEDTLGDRIGERLRSRLHEMCKIVEMNGSDLRMKVRSGNFVDR